MQTPQNETESPSLLRTNTSFHAVLKKTLKSLMPKASNHGSQCNP